MPITTLAVRLICFVALLTGCVSQFENPPLTRVDINSGYRFSRFVPDDPTQDETFVIVTVSSGGVRASAMAYGVLETLARTSGDSGQSLLDELDLLSGVSGGSFAPGYYAAHGRQKFLDDFLDDVVVTSTGWRLFGSSLWNALPLTFTDLGRSDLAAAHYHKKFFGEQTFGSLQPSRPFIAINAADLYAGTPFLFTQGSFDRLCSDLSDLPIGKAVAASVAYPGFLSPIVLDNHRSTGANRCNYEEPGWVVSALAESQTNPLRYNRARDWRSYRDRDYISLIDGVVVDRLSLSEVAESLNSFSSSWPELRWKLFQGLIRRLVVVVVDALPPAEFPTGKSTGIFSTIGGALNLVNRQNGPARLLQDLRQSFDSARDAEDWRHLWQSQCTTMARAVCDEASTNQCEHRYEEACRELYPKPESPSADSRFEYYQIYLSLEDLNTDDTLREAGSVPTALSLNKDDACAMARFGRTLLTGHPRYQDLLNTLGITQHRSEISLCEQ